MPSRDDLDKAHDVFQKNERRWQDYDVALRLLDTSLHSGTSLGGDVIPPTLAVALILQSWNRAYYLNGPDFDADHYVVSPAV